MKNFILFVSRVLSGLVFSLILVGTSAVAESGKSELVSQSTADILQKGLQYSRYWQHDRAARLYEKALKNPDLNSVDRNVLTKHLADKYLFTSREEQALELLDGVIFYEYKLDQKILQNFSFHLILRRDFEKALKVMEAHGTGYSADITQDLRQRVMVYANLGLEDRLKDVVTRFIEGNPDNEYALEIYEGIDETQNREPIILAPALAYMPARAVRSGHCVVWVVVGSTGTVEDIEDTECSERVFKKNSVKSARQYIYLPKLVNGKPVMSEPVSVKVEYRLSGEDGELIPERR